MMLLINPPLVKPSEPPPGIARLFGALSTAGVKCEVIDANIEGLLYLLGKGQSDGDRWTMRACRDRARNLEMVRSEQGYRNLQRYKRAVSDLNRLLGMSGENSGAVRLSLNNYQDPMLSAVRTSDLFKAAEEFQKNVFHEYFSKRISHAIELRSPDVLGISLNYLSQALTAFAIIGFVRARYAKVRIVLGGSLITSWVRKPHWTNPFSGLVDQVVDGPGEQALLYLAGKKDGPGPGRFSYEPFPMRDYLAPGPILSYSASRGCYWNRCAFCPEKAEGVRYASVPADAAVREAKQLCSVSKPVLMHFVDSAVSPALLSKLSENPPGVPWYGFVRVTRRLADEDFCRALKRSGCVMLKLGLESGDQKCYRLGGEGDRPCRCLKGPGLAQKGGDRHLRISSFRHSFRIRR
jgi:hypothetical protein